jgi:Protein of unknown function (DUF1569)
MPPTAQAMRTLAHTHDKVEIVSRLRKLRPESVRRWGRMSAHQMVCHVADAYRMALGRKPVSPATGPLQRTILKWVALYLPLPWPPGRLPTSPEIDQEALGTRPLNFFADVAEVETLLELLTASATDLDRPPHPTFGSMSHEAWLRWGYLHTDHHLRQFGA